MASDLSQLLKAVLRSPKYRNVHPEFVERIGAAELKKGLKLKEAIKAAKNKLHQVGGAYFTARHDYDNWFLALRETAGQPDRQKTACRKILAQHTSTKERLPILDEFYKKIFVQLPEIRSILDVACGLNPLTIPWMPLSKETTYYACDIYQDMVAFLDSCLPLFGVNGQAETCDVIAAPPTQSVDLALVLKSIPCLEQVDKHAGRSLLDTIHARHIVVSYPVTSIGGRGKGMVENYEKGFMKLADSRSWEIKKLLFETELVFIVKT